MVRIDHHEYLSTEERRLKEDRDRTKYWKKWGPYVAERQWATGKLLGTLHPPNLNGDLYSSGRL
jgi:hypothetical protein